MTDPAQTYQVLARKWRPQSFEELAGQEHVVRTLINAVSQGRVAHAYLFCGPRGVGKTSAARLLARALNCEKGPTATPCGTCAACVEISQGASSVDVAEIDGASNNGVDDACTIYENNAVPALARSLQDLHRRRSSHALAGGLQRPPQDTSRSRYDGTWSRIFATTEAHKVPGRPSSPSRCQLHTFRRDSPREDGGAALASGRGRKL